MYTGEREKEQQWWKQQKQQQQQILIQEAHKSCQESTLKNLLVKFVLHYLKDGQLSHPFAYFQNPTFLT